jgi:hypothetical protein
MSSPGYFNVHKYASGGGGATDANATYVSPADVLAGLQHMVVSFRHEPSGQSVFFKAFITTLAESYSSDWTEETVYGRTDPIQMFKQTTRRIDLGLKVPAETAGEAYDNLARIGTLTQFLYPNYDSVGSADTITQGPILRMKVMNLIRKSPSLVSDGSSGTNGALPSPSGSLDAYKSSVDAGSGLMGVITSLNIAHNLESTDVGIIQHKENTIFSTMIDINLSFTVLHEDRLGWQDNSFQTPGFPYGAVTMSPEDADKAYETLTNARAPKTDGSEGLNEQAIMLAKKRYLTMGGEARLKKDLKWIASMNQKKDELAKLLSTEGGDADRIAKLTKQINRGQSNYDYISTTIEGAYSADTGSSAPDGAIRSIDDEEYKHTDGYIDSLAEY